MLLSLSQATGRARHFEGGRAFCLSLLVLLAAVGLFVSAPPAKAAVSAVPDSGTVQIDGQVRTILPVGDRVYLGGDFTHVDGVSRNHLAAIDASTGELDPNWNPGTDDSVRSLIASPDGSRLYVGGHFTSIGGLSRQHLAVLDTATGSVDAQWKVPVNSSVRGMALVGNRLYIGGDFSTVKGASRTRLALVNALTGDLDPTWVPTANDVVQELGVSADGSRVYVGGDFTSVSGRARPFLASLDAVSGALDTAFQPPNPNGKVIDLTVSGTHVYTAEGGVGGAGAAYNIATGARSWNDHSDGNVQAVTVLAGTVYFGGHFDVVNGQTRRALVAVDATSGVLDSQWTPSATPVAPGVLAMAASASPRRVYAGGDFTSISGQSHQRFARFSDPDSLAPTITGVTPQDGSAGVALDTNAEATFSEAMDPSTINGTTFTLTKQGSSTSVVATTSYDAATRKAVLNPAADLDPLAIYTATIKGGTNGVKDLAGNPLAADRSWSFSTGADTVPPETTIDSGPIGSVNSSLATFAFSSSESNSTFECSLDGAPFASCTSPRGYQGLVDGAHTFRVRATDQATNTDPTPAERTFTVDTIVPDAPAIVSPQEGSLNKGSFSLSGTTEPNSTVEIFDGTSSLGTTQADASGTWSKTLSSVTDGTHSYSAKATDAAGNTSAPSNVRTLVVDATTPQTSLDSGPSGTLSSRTATFAFSSSESNSTFECSLDGAPFASCTSPKSYANLSNGSHTFRVRATDAAGNIDPTPASRTWKVRARG